MEEKIINQRIRMMSALGDLSLARSGMVFLAEAHEDVHYDFEDLRRFRCFEHAAIISYCRPFTAKGKFPKLGLKQCGINLSEKENELHRRVLRMRDKMVAHSDEEFMNFTSMILPIDVSQSDLRVPIVRHDEGIYFSKYMDQIEFRELITTIEFGVYRKLLETAHKEPEKLNLVKRGSAH
ncbi:hypothetical protein [Celeribacter sp.]|uniref:hypothetical protein n=1 Tax=Celeribacter sp. TaxID=1890673 RepID=UPI003A94B2E1